MIRVAALCLLAFPALAQDQEVVIRVDMAIKAPDGVVLRGLDRINGGTTDIEIGTGETATFERLEITLNECRYPEGQKNTEGYANLTIRDGRDDEPAFEGWMFASSPALSALDHPRYDVWVMRCKT